MGDIGNPSDYDYRVGRGFYAIDDFKNAGNLGWDSEGTTGNSNARRSLSRFKAAEGTEVTPPITYGRFRSSSPFDTFISGPAHAGSVSAFWNGDTPPFYDLNFRYGFYLNFLYVSMNPSLLPDPSAYSGNYGNSGENAAASVVFSGSFDGGSTPNSLGTIDSMNGLWGPSSSLIDALNASLENPTSLDYYANTGDSCSISYAPLSKFCIDLDLNVGSLPGNLVVGFDQFKIKISKFTDGASKLSALIIKSSDETVINQTTINLDLDSQIKLRIFVNEFYFNGQYRTFVKFKLFSQIGLEVNGEVTPLIDSGDFWEAPPVVNVFTDSWTVERLGGMSVYSIRRFGAAISENSPWTWLNPLKYGILEFDTDYNLTPPLYSFDPEGNVIAQSRDVANPFCFLSGIPGADATITSGNGTVVGNGINEFSSLIDIGMGIAGVKSDGSRLYSCFMFDNEGDENKFFWPFFLINVFPSQVEIDQSSLSFEQFRLGFKDLVSPTELPVGDVGVVWTCVHAKVGYPAYESQNSYIRIYLSIYDNPLDEMNGFFFIEKTGDRVKIKHSGANKITTLRMSIDTNWTSPLSPTLSVVEGSSFTINPKTEFSFIGAGFYTGTMEFGFSATQQNFYSLNTRSPIVTGVMVGSGSVGGGWKIGSL